MPRVIHERRSVVHLHIHPVHKPIVYMMIHRMRLRVFRLHIPDDVPNFPFSIEESPTRRCPQAACSTDPDTSAHCPVLSGWTIGTHLCSKSPSVLRSPCSPAGSMVTRNLDLCHYCSKSYSIISVLICSLCLESRYFMFSFEPFNGLIPFPILYTSLSTSDAYTSK